MFIMSTLLTIPFFALSDIDWEFLDNYESPDKGVSSAVDCFMSGYFDSLLESRWFQEGQLEAMSLLTPFYTDSFARQIDQLQKLFHSSKETITPKAAEKIINQCTEICKSNYEETSPYEKALVLLNDLEQTLLPLPDSKEAAWKAFGKVETLVHFLPENTEDEDDIDDVHTNLYGRIADLCCEAGSKEDAEVRLKEIQKDVSELKRLLEKNSS